MITIIIVVYHSNKMKLQTILNKLGTKYKIILVDNSTNYNFKDIKLTKKTKIIRSTNIGNGAGINLGLNKVNTKFAIYFDIDTMKTNIIQDFKERYFIGSTNSFLEPEKFISIIK